MNEFFSQPWQIQLTLASGYIAYALAYTGMRQHHRAVDTVFATLVFGLVTTASLAILPKGNDIAAGLTALTATCVVALSWRKFGRDIVWETLHRWNISWSNEDPSALVTLSGNSKYAISQFALELDDGTWLYCENPPQFDDAPFHPITIGPTGDIALYATHKEEPGKTKEVIPAVRDAAYGDKITYVPAQRVRQFIMRHLPEVSSSREEEGPRSDSDSEQPSVDDSPGL